MISKIISILMFILGTYIAIKSIYILIKIKPYSKIDTVLISIYFILFIAFNFTTILGI